MTNRTRSFPVFLLLVSAVILTGCDTRFKSLPGTYEGDFSRIENGSAQSFRATATVQPADLGHNTAKIVVTETGTTRTLFDIFVKKHGSHILLRSSILAESTEIELKDHFACADHVPHGEGLRSLASFCLQSGVISLFSTDRSGNYRALLYLTKKAASPSQPDPNNRPFSLDDIFRRILDSSYETRIATERLVQSYQEVQLVRSRLFPSLGASSGLALVSYPLAATSMIGTLVPFIFPTHWFEWNRQKALYQGEVMAYKSLIANQMNLAEDLFYQILRDRKLFDQITEILDLLNQRRETVSARIRLGYTSESDLLELDDLILKAKNDSAKLQQGFVSQLAILSRGIGLSPRHGIESLLEPAPRDSAPLHALASEELMAEALSTSLELRQVLFLERAAVLQERAEYFSFINPSDWLSLNEGTVHRIKIAKSALREVQILREATQGKIEEQVISLSSLYNQLLDQNLNLEKEIANRQAHLSRIEALYQNGSTSILEVKIALEGLIRMKGEKITAEMALDGIRGKLNRLLWKNAYAIPLQMQVPI